MSTELKDMVLSTLAEIEGMPLEDNNKEIQKQQESIKTVKKTILKEHDSLNIKESVVDSELKYLNALRERFLVLFEGFQAPNNANIEAKIDLTLNFLEYVLSTLDNRISLLEKGKK